MQDVCVVQELHAIVQHAEHLQVVACVPSCNPLPPPAMQDFCVVQELYATGEIPRSGQQCYIVCITDGGCMRGVDGCAP